MKLQSLAVVVFCFYSFVVQGKRKKNRTIRTSSESTQTMEYALLGIAVIVLLGALIFLLKRKEKLLRAQKLKSIKSALQVKQISCKDKSCTMTQMQKDQAIGWFSKQNWVLEEILRKQKISTQLQIVDIKRKQQGIDGSKYLRDYYDAFYVKMKGKGMWKCDIFGTIMFQKFYPTFIFERSTSNSRNSQGFYDYTFFESFLKKGVFEGRWHTSNDKKVQAQKQEMIQKQRQKQRDLQQAVSQRSFSRLQKQSDETPSTSKQKQSRGLFRLYHK